MKFFGSFDEGGTTAVGQGFLFSSTSEAIAIWNSPNLEVRYLRDVSESMRQYAMNILNIIELQPSSSVTFESLVGVAQWSPDGRFLAFTDAEGLWLWDVYTPITEPRLLIATSENSDLPVADYFSPRGRYLAFSQGKSKETLDTISGHHYPYGVVSPDDRTLLVTDPPNSDTPVKVCSFTPYQCWQEVPYFRQVAWQNSDRYLAIACYSDGDCVFEIGSPSDAFNARSITFSFTPGEMFAYDSQLDLLAVLSEGYTVTINDIALDLSDGLDGYVVNMEWLPSMFYFID